MSDHKRNLNKLKAEIMSGIFSDHNGIKLEINYQKKDKWKCKYNIQRLNGIQPNKVKDKY